MKAAHLHAEVWHSHGPNDPAMVEGYYAGCRWIRITLLEEQCLVQLVANWRDGAAAFNQTQTAQNPPLEHPGQLFSYENWRDIEILIRSAKQSSCRHPAC
jgi:hypothetical protein